MRNILLPVQYLRALAALAVFQYHLSATFNGQSRSRDVPLEEIGAAGVDLFFVISGFIMASVVWNRSITFSGFMTNRIIRIVPLYWAATFVVFGIAVLAPSLLGSTTADAVQLLHSLFFIPNGMNSDSIAPILIVGWTLNYEMFFYFVIAIFASLLNDRKLIFTSIFICSLAVAGLIFQPANDYVQFYINPIILEFPLGILVFHCWRLTKSSEINYIFGVAFLLCVAWLSNYSSNSEYGLRAIHWGIPAAVLLYASLRWATFKSDGLKRVGDWSYSIYLLHLFFIMGFHKVIVPMLMPSPILLSVLAVIMTGLLIFASALSYHWFERPVANWLNERLNSKTATVSQS